MTTDIMFDIETLDIKPSAVVLSIGAVKFDAVGAIHDRFYRVIGVQSQLDEGRTVSFDTMRWWINQAHNAQNEAFSPVRREVGAAFGEFFSWCRLEPGHNARDYWAWGPQFDAVIMEDVARTMGCLVPWGYGQLRDARTVCEEAKVDRRDHDSKVVGTPHTPVYDCERQVELLTLARGRFF